MRSDASWAERCRRRPYPPGPGAVRDRAGRSRADLRRRERCVDRGAPLRRDRHRRPVGGGEQGTDGGHARRRGRAALGRPARPLPDGRRLAPGLLHRGRARHRPLRLRAADPGGSHRAALDEPREAQPRETPASWTTRVRPTPIAAARPAATTRGPTSPTCSAPRSCSRIGSRRSTTSPILRTSCGASAWPSTRARTGRCEMPSWPSTGAPERGRIRRR